MDRAVAGHGLRPLGAAASSSAVVGVHDVDPHRCGGQGAHHGAQGAGGPATSTDHPTQVLRVHPHLEQLPPAQRTLDHPHVVRMVDDAADQVVEGVGQHQACSSVAAASSAGAASAGASAGTSAVSSAGAASARTSAGTSAAAAAASAAALASAAAAASAAALASAAAAAAASAAALAAAASAAAAAAAFSLALAALALAFSAASAAALMASAASAEPALVRRVPSVPGRPLNFCQSPVILRITRTCSLGWAPTPSQYWARAESTSIREGSSVGWYLPISSITRPSRLVRESATTMR